MRELFAFMVFAFGLTGEILALPGADDLRCAPVGDAIELQRIEDDASFGRYISPDECEDVRQSAHGGVVCAWFTPDMPIGRGGWPETGWRPMNILTKTGLGRRAMANLHQCLAATRVANGGVVCTNTGIGAKSTNINTNKWCGSSSEFSYCTSATTVASNRTVCSFPSDGSGADAGWVRTVITDRCEYQGTKMSLEDCNETIGGFRTRDQSDRRGYVQFMNPDELRPFLLALPNVEDQSIQAVLRDPDTMWYDHDAMVPVYQDSVTPVIGVRANSIGRRLAVDGHLVFNTRQQFHFPFATTAGTDASDVKVLTFWAPAKRGEQTLPVVWWRDDTTRFRWIFPKNTVFGEVLYIERENNWYAFEIRTRQRFLTGWGVQVFRPFPTADSLSEAIIDRRPNWRDASKLRRLVEHLQNSRTLRPKRLESRYFGPTFEPVEGFSDSIPEFEDDELVKTLLTETMFVSVEGQVWKRDGSRETYAPTTTARFSIVPKNYEMGVIPVDDVSCNRCHQDTGRQIGEFSFNSLLYGEIWGEDRIFSWHLFDPDANIYNSFHRNRRLNPRLVRADLLARLDRNRHPETVYKELPRRFPIIWR